MGSAALPVMAQEANSCPRRQPERIQPKLDAFSAETGITAALAFVDKGTDERLEAQGDRLSADPMPSVELAQPVQPDVPEASIPATGRDRADHRCGPTARARVVCAAFGRVAEGEVTTCEDPADPKWQGRFCTRPGLNGDKIMLPAAVIRHRGAEAAETRAEGLKAGLARKPDGGDRDEMKAIPPHLNIPGVAIARAAADRDDALRIMDEIEFDV